MKRADAIKHILNSNGLNVQVRFLKRTSNEIREMICRIDETKATTKKKGTISDYNLITVWDVEKDHFRSIPIDGILAIVVDNKWVEIDDCTIHTVSKEN